MADFFSGGWVRYDADGSYGAQRSFDSTGNRTITEDPTPDVGGTGSVNDVFEVGEEVLWNGADYQDIYVGYIAIGGDNMPVLQFTNGRLYVMTPQDTYPIDYDSGDSSFWPATLQVSDLVQESFVFCFAAGTRISTSGACVAVEDLQIGDQILAADGSTVPVKWIGRQTLRKLFSGPRIQPVRIRAGALGGGLPTSDLTVTGDHGMVIDGLVINASALVNGTTIDWVPMAELEDSFTVYHIETENHDVILANGAPSETFVDAVSRAHFADHQEYLDLYGVERIIPGMDRPRISSQRLLPSVLKMRLGITDQVLDFVDLDPLQVAHTI